MTGYAKALASYDPNRAAKFATFAINCIRNEIQYCLRKEYRHYRNNVSMNATKHVDKNGNDLSLEDTLADEAENGADIVNNEALRGIIKNRLRDLQPAERYVITYRYGLDRGMEYTQNQIAEITGMSQANVSKIEKNSLIKMKELLRGEAF
jgi:RNA polymerase sporulation-specific sigma factor